MGVGNILFEAHIYELIEYPQHCLDYLRVELSARSCDYFIARHQRTKTGLINARRRHRVEDVGYFDNSRSQRNGVSKQAIRIATPVQTFMVPAGDLGCHVE